MSSRAYYNEFDPGAAAWLRQLITDGLIAPGDVDERSICDVQGSDLDGYTQIHLFAGVAGWSLALRLAGWPDDRPVWTGSAPCQPFSSAGKRQGQADERHLWPEMFRLIRERRPERVFGEQVEAAIRLGWLDGVFANLEGEGYACGAVVLGAHSVGAPHIRQRLWWVADAEGSRYSGGMPRNVSGTQRGPGAGRRGVEPIHNGDACGLGNADRGRQQQDDAQVAAGAAETGFWSNAATIPCGDGKARRIEPGIAPLADGLPARVVRLRGYGNAIVPQIAAAFIEAADAVIGGAA